MGSGFFAPTVSRYIAAEGPVSKFLVRHPTLSRFIAHIPVASKSVPLPAVATVSHVAPVYNARARKPRAPTFRM
jgi:hypothetical protein